LEGSGHTHTLTKAKVESVDFFKYPRLEQTYSAIKQTFLNLPSIIFDNWKTVVVPL